MAFDTAKLIGDLQHALIGRVPVGVAPVGVVVVDGGSKVLTANSNRFAGGADDHSTLTVIDARNVAAGAGAVLGTVAAGAFPREMRVTADGKTLLVTNFASKSLEMIDVSRMPVQAPPH
jgi:DNA-binding beta-propeller fold protein YncE